MKDRRIATISMMMVLGMALAGCNQTDETKKSKKRKPKTTTTEVTDADETQPTEEVTRRTTTALPTKAPTQSPKNNQEPSDFYAFLEGKELPAETARTATTIEYEYDDQDRKVKSSTLIANNEEKDVWVYAYDDAGNLIEETRSYEFGGESRYAFGIRHEYDSHGNETSQLVQKDGEWVERYHYSYEFDENGVMRRKYTTDHSTPDFPTQCYEEYDEHGQIIGTDKGDTYEYYYDENGNLVHVLYQRNGFQYFDTDDYEYNEEGLLVASSGNDSNGWNKEGIYNERGQIVEQKTYSDETFSMIIYWTHYEYDEDGRLICEASYNAYSSSYDVIVYALEITEYEYDEHGNLVQSTLRVL